MGLIKDVRKQIKEEMGLLQSKTDYAKREYILRQLKKIEKIIDSGSLIKKDEFKEMLKYYVENGKMPDA